MNCTNLKSAYLHSALRRLGYSYAKAMAAPAIRAVLAARIRAAEKMTSKDRPIQERLL